MPTFNIRYQVGKTHYLDYEIEPTLDDYMDYLIEKVITVKFPDKATSAWARLALGEFIVEFDLKDQFEEDDEFKEFLEERYYDEAMRSI